MFNVRNNAQNNPIRQGYTELVETGNYAAALPLVKKAVEKEDALAMSVLGTMYMLGRGVERDMQEAYLWFLQAANRGEPSGMTALGMCLATGRGAPINRSDAAYWLYRAGSNGYWMAVGTLGELVNNHPELVGQHFSEEQLCDLLERYKQAAIAQAKAAGPVARPVGSPLQ